MTPSERLNNEPAPDGVGKGHGPWDVMLDEFTRYGLGSRNRLSH